MISLKTKVRNLAASPPKTIPFEQLKLEDVFPPRDAKRNLVTSLHGRTGYSAAYKADIDEGVVLHVDIDVPDAVLRGDHHDPKVSGAPEVGSRANDGHEASYMDLDQRASSFQVYLHEHATEKSKEASRDHQLGHDLELADGNIESLEVMGDGDGHSMVDIIHQIEFKKALDPISEKVDEDEKEFQTISEFQTKPRVDPANDPREVPLNQTTLNLRRYASIIDQLDIDPVDFTSKTTNYFAVPVDSTPKLSDGIKKACYGIDPYKESNPILQKPQHDETNQQIKVSKIGLVIQEPSSMLTVQRSSRLRTLQSK